MNLESIFREEDMFPREITEFINRDYGVLFFNEDEKDSYDSNHALIFKDKVQDIDFALQDIVNFYQGKGINPSIYQSISEEGYFDQISDKLVEHGFEYWNESQNYMVLLEDNKIKPNPDISVREITQWKDEYGVEIFQKADEPWEIAVMKRVLENDNTLFFIAFYQDKPVGMMHGHITDGVCRADYLLVSKEHRQIGVGKTITHYLVEYCRKNNIDNCFLWPGDIYAERIYNDGGFRTVAKKQAGRATYKQQN